MKDRKTNRKNKTNQVVNWPSSNDYFTIKSLMEMNPEFVEITLRVKLKKEIDETNFVQEIGYKNCGKGRPEKVFALKPATKCALDKAIADGITIEAPSTPMPVIQINPKVQITTTTPVTKFSGGVSNVKV